MERWDYYVLCALGATPYVFFLAFMHLLKLQRDEDDRMSREDDRLQREFDEEMRRYYPKWGKR